MTSEETARFFADPYVATVVPGIARFLSGTDHTLTVLIAAASVGQRAAAER